MGVTGRFGIKNEYRRVLSLTDRTDVVIMIPYQGYAMRNASEG